MKKPVLSRVLKRKLLLIAVISLLLASALQLYTFGLASGFLLGWLRAFFVFFVMIALAVLAIIPGVNYSVNRLAKK